METNFKEFFLNIIRKERVEVFQPHYFRKLYEMAVGTMEEPDVVRMPVNIDEDDIEFLKQFPHEFWAKALEIRYNKLFERIEEYNREKETAGHDVLKNAIYNAIKNQDDKSWNDLLRLSSDTHNENEHIKLNKDKVEKLKKKYPDSWSQTRTDEKIMDIADMEADEHLKIIFPHIKQSETETFEFIDNRFDFDKARLGGSNRTSKKIRIVAKPFLNRLYHKLERTEGLEHLHGSGLEELKGKYGFFMRGTIRSHNTDELPHSTAGMKFPTQTQIRDRMRDFLVQNFHRTFGEIDQPGVIWKPALYEDAETVRYYKIHLERQIENQLESEFKRHEKMAKDGNEESKVYINAKENSSRGERLKKARKLANDQLISMAEAGKLKGPPIGPTTPGGPPLAPDGLPVKVENGKLINPKFYLPYKKEKVKYANDRGEIEEKEEWIPVVKAAKFYREIEHGEFVPEEKKMGHRKNYVHIGDDQNPYAKGVQRDAAIDFNHNTESLSYLSDEEKEEAQRLIFGPQRQVIFSRNRLVPMENSGFYEDIMQGILNCVASNCSGTEEHERMLMLQNINEIHACIYQTMIKDLGGHEDRFDTSAKRVLYAHRKAALYAQKDLGEGGGTRRLRAFVQAVRDGRVQNGTPYGNRNLDTREHRNAYRLNNFRTIMREMQQLRTTAAQVDSTSSRIIQQSHQTIGSRITGSLHQIMRSRAEIVNQAIDLLQVMHQFKNNSSVEEAKDFAEKKIKDWIQDGFNSTDMINAMTSLSLVKNIADELEQSGDEPTDRSTFDHAAGLEDEIRSAIQIANHDLQDQLSRRGNNKNDPEIVQRFKSQLPELSQYVSDDRHGGLAQQIKQEFEWLRNAGNEDELRKILTGAQKEINTKLT
jgi:hypothetical protein